MAWLVVMLTERTPGLLLGRPPAAAGAAAAAAAEPGLLLP
jgi:hypothetical protein